MRTIGRFLLKCIIVYIIIMFFGVILIAIEEVFPNINKGFVVIGLILLSFLSYLFWKKKTQKKTEPIYSKKLLNTDTEKEYKIVMYNDTEFQKSKIDNKTHLLLDIVDEKEKASLLINKKQAGSLSLKDYKEIRPFLNNNKYDTYFDINLREEDNSYKWMYVYFNISVKENTTTEETIEVESDAMYKGFNSDDFFLTKNYNKIDREYLYPKKYLEDTSNFFYGKKVVITGKFETLYFRNKIAKALWEVGADVDTTIGKKTDIVLMGSYNVGPKKLEQIIARNIKIIREDELKELLKDKL